MGYATNKTLVAVAFHWSSDSWLAYTSQCSEEERRESSSLQVSDLASCCDHPRDFIQSQSSQHCLKKCLSTGTAGSASQSQYSRGWSWATWFSHSEPQEPNHQLGMSSLGKTIISTLFFSSQTFILKSRMLLVYLDYPAMGAWLNSENVRWGPSLRSSPDSSLLLMHTQRRSGDGSGPLIHGTGLHFLDWVHSCSAWLSPGYFEHVRTEPADGRSLPIHSFSLCLPPSQTSVVVF